MSAEYEIQTRAWIVKPKGATIFDETATTIKRDDEGNGQFLKVMQYPEDAKPGEIRISPEEWPAIKDAIEAAFHAILADELHEFAPKGNP